MKVLACIRNDFDGSLGGDSIQITKTVEYLRRKGIDIVISTNLKEDLRPYDIVHLFNTIRIGETYRYYGRCKTYKKKIVLTPIYWNYGRYLCNNLNDSKYMTRWIIDNALRKEVIKNVDLILPSSKLEIDSIQQELKVRNQYKIIYNGVDANFSKGDSEKFLKKYRLKDSNFVLTVGRICPHKNQLTMAKVCKSLNVPYVIIGQINDMEYFNRCKNEYSSLTHIDRLDHEELADAYSAAKVHSLVSWYETPGLATLEAGIAGCNILTTSEGSTKEYFKDYVEYSMWNDYDSILQNTIKLLNKDRNHNLKNHITNNFLWDNIADSIVDAYDRLLSNKVY